VNTSFVILLPSLPTTSPLKPLPHRAALFELSAVLGGHDLPIRGVAVSGDDTIAALEASSHVSVWRRQAVSDDAAAAAAATTVATADGVVAAADTNGSSDNAEAPAFVRDFSILQQLMHHDSAFNGKPLGICINNVTHPSFVRNAVYNAIVTPCDASLCCMFVVFLSTWCTMI
jgi:hypothetical protein